MRRYLLSLAVTGMILGTAFSVAAQQQSVPTTGAPQAAPVPPSGGAFGASVPAASPLPDGPGKETVSVACTQCHGPSVFAQLRMGENAWRAQTYDMILRGAQITPADIDTVVKYMATSYGPGVPFPGQQPAQVSVADGAGKPLVEGGCALCHGLDRVIATKRTKDQWKTIVNRMVFLGSPISDDQLATVVDYLAINYSPTPDTATK